VRNFQLLAQGINTVPLLHEIQVQPALWNSNPLRTLYPQSPHREADDIWLRFNEIPLEVEKLLAVAEDKECINYEGMAALPCARPIIFDLMRLVEGEQLGRCMITRLAPGKRIYPHEDQGAPAEYYDRYHVMLQNGPGSLFRCGNETVNMKAGECWWFENRREHEVVNNSCDDRITMIIDIRPSK
jgi:hypothetical protein